MKIEVRSIQSHLPRQTRDRPFLVAHSVALLILVTVGAVCVWAHAGHEALRTGGAKTIKNKDGTVTGVVLSAEARDSLDLKTARVEERRVSQRVLAYASLVTPWQKHAFATARLGGRVERMRVRPGDAVRAGQVLADVQSVELESLQMELLSARTDERLSAKLLAAADDLSRRGVASEQTLMEARNKHRQNLDIAEVARSKWAGLGRGELDMLYREGKPVLSSLPVRSPIGGTVIHADLIAGKVVEPTEHLFEVVDLSTVWVKIGVLERDMHRVKHGQEVELTFQAYPGEVVRTRIRVIGT